MWTAETTILAQSQKNHLFDILTNTVSISPPSFDEESTKVVQTVGQKDLKIILPRFRNKINNFTESKIKFALFCIFRYQVLNLILFEVAEKVQT